MNISVSTPRLASYLTLGLGAGLLGTAGSDAATLVTLYGPGSRNPSSTIPTPAGIDIGNAGYGYINISTTPGALLGQGAGNIYFTRGTDITVGRSENTSIYSYETTGMRGALLNSDQNFSNITFNGDDGVYEAVGQFYLDGANGGYLVAIARNDGNTALSISAGKAAITTVPEPSSIALLALGAAGVLVRRRRVA